MKPGGMITKTDVETMMAFFDTPISRPHGARGTALFAVAMRAFEVRRQRAALQRLTDLELSDIGLTRQDVSRELAKGFWDVPDTWRT